ncbi:MAG: TorF family putative porin [Gammaproteobacteria bacterium]|nr:TorF family putative porin [Gammaproteobacteria bacterium]
MFKKTLLSTAVAGSLIAGSMVAAPAMAGVSMNIGATSNYMWRGWTQSGEEAAISGGLDYAHDSGFYAGTWTSSLGGGQYELDFYAGFGGEFAEDWAYDVGYIYYAYPIDRSNVKLDFGELYGSLGWKGLTLFGAVQTNSTQDAVILDGSDVTDESYYLSLDYLFEYGDGFSTDLLIGYAAGDQTKAYWGDTYMHYYADVTKSTDYGDVTLALSISDFDETANGEAINDPRVIISWAKEF